MRRHCLSRADVAAALWLTQLLLFALRAMLLSALSVSSLFGDSVHRMRSVLIRAKGAAIFRAVFLERWTKFAWRTRLMLEIRSAISGQISRGHSPRFRVA